MMRHTSNISQITIRGYLYLDIARCVADKERKLPNFLLVSFEEPLNGERGCNVKKKIKYVCPKIVGCAVVHPC